MWGVSMGIKSVIDKVRIEVLEREFSGELCIETTDSAIYITHRNDITDINDFLSYIKVANVINVYSSASDNGLKWLPVCSIVAVLERKDGEYIKHKVREDDTIWQS